MGIRIATMVLFLVATVLAEAPRAPAGGREASSAQQIVRSGMLSPSAAIAVNERSDRVFVLNTGNSSLAVLDARSGALLHTLYVEDAAPGIALDETSGHLFVPAAISATVDMRDGTTGRLLRTITLPQRPVVAIPTGWHGRVFVVIGTPTPNGGTIESHAAIAVLDGQSGHLVRVVPLTVPGGGLSAIAVDVHRGHILLAASRTVDIVDAVNGTVLHSVVVPRYISAFTVDQHTHTLFAIGTGSGGPHGVVQPALLFTLDARSGRILQTRPLARVILVKAAAAIDEQTRRLFIASALEHLGATGVAGGLVVRDVDTGAAVRTTVPGPSAIGLALCQQTRRVFVINDFAPAQMLDGRTGAVLDTIAVPDQAQAVAVDERTVRVFIATAISVHVLDARTGSMIRTDQLS